MVAARVLTPTEMTLFLVVEIVLGSTWAWLGAGERPPLLAIVGGLIAIVALVIETLASGREHAARGA
jgi:drug/metabolite transporter (DMT)-like permease